MRARFEDTEQWLTAGRLGDEVLRSVAYILPRSLEGELLRAPPYESAPMGVELGFESGRGLAITWHMAGKCHGLVMGDGPVEELRDFRMPLARRDPVSEDWERRIGKALRSISARWHVSDGGCLPTIWAVNLSFGTLDTVIGLGELSAAGPTYMPDELVVGFGPEGVAAFKNPAEIQVG